LGLLLYVVVNDFFEIPLLALMISNLFSTVSLFPLWNLIEGSVMCDFYVTFH